MGTGTGPGKGTMERLCRSGNSHRLGQGGRGRLGGWADPGWVIPWLCRAGPHPDTGEQGKFPEAAMQGGRPLMQNQRPRPALKTLQP